ncbi:MAG: glucans biosynthesis glucosyltransferase MdoH, partial [Microvirga sp.]
LSTWLGRDGIYWGHTAIIRTRAFGAHGGLPDLKGRPPLGGHILSHDFVEAALLRRAGWTVYMLPELGGSYEESPPSLIDLAARDRRWCQGNLQHMRVFSARGFKLPTRQHFATGIMSYLASPFWLFQLIVGIALVLQTTYIRPEYFARDFRLFPVWPRFDPERALALFALTMGILLAPKLFGLVLMVIQGDNRRASGGAIRLTVSTIIEIALAALFAPILMLIQSGSVFQILLGRDTGWQPQRRDDGSIPLRDIVRRHRWHTALGLFAGISAFLIATSLFLWMSPTIVGLLLAIPLSWLSGQLSAGLALKRLGLLMTPEERQPPEIAVRANELQVRNAAFGFDDEEALMALYADPGLRQHHLDMLPPVPARRRGDIETERALAAAKLVDAETIEEALEWLKPRERMVVLHDRALLDLAVRLKSSTMRTTQAAE